MEQNTIGISEDKIDKLVLDLYDYIEKRNNIFNNITNEMDQVSTILNTSAGRTLTAKFNNQKAMFPIVNDNLVKITELLIATKQKTIDFSKDLASQINKNAGMVEIPDKK